MGTTRSPCGAEPPVCVRCVADDDEVGIGVLFCLGIDELAFIFEVAVGFLQCGGNGAAGKALADVLAGLLVGGKLLEVGQVTRAAQAELLQKRRSRSIDDGLAALGVASHLAHEALVDERGDDAVGVDAADALHGLARHRLVVGDDCERFQSGLRELLGVPAHNECLDLVMIGRMREQAPPSCDLAQLKAAVGLLVLDLELSEQRGDLSGGDVQYGGERACAHRVA